MSTGQLTLKAEPVERAAGNDRVDDAVRHRSVPFTLVLCAGAGLLVSGCSLSFPIAGFVADGTPTGSIERSAAVLSNQLDQEDWRRAKAALAVALDPQGNGASVTWDNPQSGAKGSFVAVAAPFTKTDHVCRAFLAHVNPDAGSGRTIKGSACRSSDGEWVVAEAKEDAAKKKA